MIGDLMAEIPPGERYAEAARGWFEGVLGEVFGDLREGLRTRPATRKISKHWDDGPEGEPGQVRGELETGTSVWKSRMVVFTEASWQQFLGELGKSPAIASLCISVIGQNGYLSEDGAVIRVVRYEEEPDWVRFTFWAPALFTWRARMEEGHRFGGTAAVQPGPGGGWIGSAELQDRWAAVVRRLAARIGVSAGMITVRGGGPGIDEVVTYPDWPPENVVQPPEYVQEIAMLGSGQDVLYRYSWVTVVPTGLVARLGGAADLASSGAFFEVSELPDGSVWLRATKTIDEFDAARSAAVAAALGPVLVAAQVL